MHRREFLSFAAGGAVVLPQAAEANTDRMDELICRLDAVVRAEIPEVTRVEVTYDPANTKLPLMILAFRDD